MDENDPRRLKPGEIDPTPEIRPARADAKDMDDDEKEMIAEGRVRLANIKGKKAKRRAREKVIEESRRLAQLQKQRELKAAGIDFLIERRKKKKKKEMDYNAEIPFEHRPVELVYRTGPEENPGVNQNVSNVSLNVLEGPRRDAEEKNKRKQDQRTIKKLKKLDLSTRVEKMNVNNPLLYENYGDLKLADPQLTDGELGILGKMAQVSSDIQMSLSQEITRNLVGNYSVREPTPVKTPKYSDGLMKDARQSMALHHSESPMIGGETSIYLDDLNIAKKGSKSSTPNPYKNILVGKTPELHRSNAGTPLSLGFRQTPLGLRTPLSQHQARDAGLLGKRSKMGDGGEVVLEYNDELELNNNEWTDSNWENASAYSGYRGSTSNMKEDRNLIIRDMIKKALMDLPDPRNDYNVDIEMMTLNKGSLAEPEEPLLEKDMQELDEIRERMMKRDFDVSQKLQTLTVQNKLPRLVG
jgi:hypothetical protein